MSSASHTARDQETKVLRTHLNVSINRTDGMLRIYSDPIPPPEHARPTAPSNRLTDPHPDLFSTSPIFPRALHSTAFNTPLQPKLAQSRLAILGIVHTSPSHPPEIPRLADALLSITRVQAREERRELTPDADQEDSGRCASVEAGRTKAVGVVGEGCYG
ncbi:hypothetical protein H2201_003409 [Coniosporium apollinis]|uniref:Uncharacterized protein n=1 Tax=Coniosporium apollinis TaxID=61459 RepID=A0ABQ9P268_9PEZI|nr:hypothetical protein H2201_003409 [Coniosporium apollinis]